jgi:distribution and morphology protein 31
MSGRFDVVADIRFPRDSAADVDINTIIAEIVDNLANAVAGNAPSSAQPDNSGRAEDHNEPIPGQHKLNEPAIQAPLTAGGPAAEKAWRESKKATGLTDGVLVDADRDAEQARAVRRQRRRERLKALFGIDQDAPILNIEDGERTEDEASSEKGEEEEQATKPPAPAAPVTPAPLSVVIDLDVRFKDIKAAVPLFDSELTYSKQAFVRPIVAFMNANRVSGDAAIDFQARLLAGQLKEFFLAPPRLSHRRSSQCTVAS